MAAAYCRCTQLCLTVWDAVASLLPLDFLSTSPEVSVGWEVVGTRAQGPARLALEETSKALLCVGGSVYYIAFYFTATPATSLPAYITAEVRVLCDSDKRVRLMYEGLILDR